MNGDSVGAEATGELLETVDGEQAGNASFVEGGRGIETDTTANEEVGKDLLEGGAGPAGHI